MSFLVTIRLKQAIFGTLVPERILHASLCLKSFNMRFEFICIAAGVFVFQGFSLRIGSENFTVRCIDRTRAWESQAVKGRTEISSTQIPVGTNHFH